MRYELALTDALRKLHAECPSQKAFAVLAQGPWDGLDGYGMECVICHRQIKHCESLAFDKGGNPVHMGCKVGGEIADRVLEPVRRVKLPKQPEMKIPIK